MKQRIAGYVAIALAIGLSVAVKKNMELREKLVMVDTKFKLTVEEFNMAFKLLTTEEQKLVYKKFLANDAYLNALFPSTDS